MKYGLLYWKDTNNIGDDIQSYAGLQFLPQTDYLIDREFMHSFISRDREPVAVIMNAWFLYNKFNWPPANDIYPLFEAMHFSAGKDYQSGLAFLDGIGGDYLRHFGPVGCRDETSRDLLLDKGIDAYYSGCLTLTLPKQPKVETAKPTIYLVDTEPRVKRALERRVDTARYDMIEIKHMVDSHVYSLLPVEERMQMVGELLTRYQNAVCVVTTRLHCALPCLAIETPVLFLCDDTKNYRLKSFLQYLHVSTTDDFCSGKEQYSVTKPPQNGTGHIPLKNELTNRTRAFIENTKMADPEELNLFAASPDERAAFQTDYLRGCFNMIDSMGDAEIKRYLKNCGLRQLTRVMKTGLGCLPATIRRAIKRRI